MSTEIEGQGTMEGISELLRCYICMGRLTRATVCPHCSKLGCFACIKRWVTDNRSDCPHCRNPLTLSDLIKIPLFDDLGLVLDNLHGSTQELAPVSSKVSESLCTIHHEKMSVYCETCKECICHNCALWSAPHCGHIFKPLDDLYKRHVVVLQGELTKLKDRLKDIVGHVQQVERKIEEIKLNKSKVKKEMTHMVEKTCHHLDELAKERIELLKEFHEYLCNQAVDITKESHDLEKTIAAGNVSTLVNNNGDLKSDISATLKRLLTSYKKMEALPTITHFANMVVPEYDSAIFKISSFRELQRRGKEIYSELLQLQGLVWRLKVYPNGHKEEVGNYLAVFVELSEGYNRVTNYQYCIEMLYGCSNKTPLRNHKREYSSEFADGESWGYLKYYELSHLQESGFLKDNTLMIKFHVRAPTYYQKYEDQNLYLQKVLKERNALKLQVQSTKQQMSSLKSEYKVLLLGGHRSSTHATSNSRTTRSQQASHTPLTLHSSQQNHLTHTGHPQVSQSHSAHQEPRPQRERNTSHMNPEKAHQRALIAQSTLNHPSHTHTYSHSGSTLSAFSSSHSESQIMRGGSSRLIPASDPLVASSQMLPGTGRQKSHENSTEFCKIADQRRKSGDTVFFHTHKKDLGGHPNYSHKCDHSRPQVDPNTITVQTKCHIKELSGRDQLESSSSQKWEDPSLNHADIIVMLNAEEGRRGDRSKSSSCSTLIECGTPSREVKEKQLQLSLSSDQQQHDIQLELSQERFGDDDCKEMISLSTLAEGHGTAMPLSNYYPLNNSESYYGEDQEGFQSHSFTAKQDQDQALFQDLSQPYSSPKSHHGKSLTDLTNSNGSPSCSQHFLSQSVADFQHMQQHHTESNHHVTTSQRRPHEHRFRGPPVSHISSDSHLNKTHIPGLQRSLIHALSEVREVEHRKQHRRGKKQSPALLHGGPQQLQPPHSSSTMPKKHVKATVVCKHSQKRIGLDSSAHNQKKGHTLTPLVKPEGRRASSKGSEISQAPGEARRAPPTVNIHLEAENHMHLLSGTHDNTLTATECSELSSTANTKSNSNSSLNNLSLIL